MNEFQPIVSAAWLCEHLEDPQLTIADCRFSLTEPELGRQQYQNSHIPGAFYLDLNRDLSSLVQKHGGRHPLPNPTELADKLSSMGIDSQTLVVAYDDSRFAFAARLWWLLRYMGHERVAVLDGGFQGWLFASLEKLHLRRQLAHVPLTLAATTYEQQRQRADHRRKRIRFGNQYQ